VNSNKHSTQSLHISFTERDGYVWRKRHSKQMQWVPDSVRYHILSHAHTTTSDRVYKTRQPLKQMLLALNKATVMSRQVQ